MTRRNRSSRTSSSAYAAYPWNNKARLVANGKILDAHSYGFNPHDELELLALTSKPERASNDKRISEVFST